MEAIKGVDTRLVLKEKHYATNLEREIDVLRNELEAIQNKIFYLSDSDKRELYLSKYNVLSNELNKRLDNESDKADAPKTMIMNRKPCPFYL